MGARPLLGTGREITIRELAETIARHTGFTGEPRWDPSQPNGQPRRALATERAEQRFGFRAEVGFEEGLRETITWWESHKAVS